MPDPATKTGEPAISSVNVGRPHSVEWRGRLVTTALWKEQVSGGVWLRGVNFVGDDQADRRVHGGVDKAVYAYAAEDYDWWSTTTGVLAPGTFGENLTTTGIDLNGCLIGERWHVGSAILEVAQPRQPCFKLGIRMGDDAFPGQFAAAGRPGLYLRVVAEGVVAMGDVVTIEEATLPAVSIGSLVGEAIDGDVVRQVAADPRVPDGWRRSAERVLENQASRPATP